MSAAENKLLLQQIFAEMAKGNSRPLVENMTDDFSWTVSGTTKWSRTYAPKQTVLSELFPPLRAHMADRIKTIAQRFIAEDDLVVVEARGSNTTTSGKPYNNSYCFVFRVADGKLKEVTEYMDTFLVNAVLGEEPKANG
ncbi:MAG TPA: nuclear transport factor 2 family protein [Candidatus Angelobacter sp.]